MWEDESRPERVHITNTRSTQGGNRKSESRDFFCFSIANEVWGVCSFSLEVQGDSAYHRAEVPLRHNQGAEGHHVVRAFLKSYKNSAAGVVTVYSPRFATGGECIGRMNGSIAKGPGGGIWGIRGQSPNS